ncbi:MAG: hypothetical protein MI723_10485, partial [Caulobacterales bacterium]|nr:hypothetical protein [Caulobacterales bacterium]
MRWAADHTSPEHTRHARRRRLLAGACALATASATPAAADNFAVIAASPRVGAAETFEEGAKNDAEWFRRFLQRTQGVTPDRTVTLYHDDPADIAELWSEDAPAAYLTSPENPDRVYFYYAGSGFTGPGANVLSLDELLMWLARLGAEQTVVVLEASLEDETFEAPPGMVVVTAADIDQTAQTDPDGGFAVFTHALLHGVRGPADLNRDQEVSLREAGDFAAAALAQWAEAEEGRDPQTPVIIGDELTPIFRGRGGRGFRIPGSAPAWLEAAERDWAARASRG